MPPRRERPGGIGTPSGPSPVADREVEAGARRARAAREPLDVVERSGAPFPIVEVRNPAHGTQYQVVLPEFPGGGGAMCSCDDFTRRPVGTCKHVEASLLALAAHRPAAGTSLPFDPDWARALWRTVGERLSAAGPPRDWDPRRLRSAGGLLLESVDPWDGSLPGRAGVKRRRRTPDSVGSED
ncbi:MAG TPA: hypothetical protein VFF67_05645 [Thermoplasmata archaeon]|nr:hypothetical protein [Thermoplasmata archaeon]